MFMFWDTYDSLALNFSYEFNLCCEFLEQMYFFPHHSGLSKGHKTEHFEKNVRKQKFDLAPDFRTFKILVCCSEYTLVQLYDHFSEL